NSARAAQGAVVGQRAVRDSGGRAIVDLNATCRAAIAAEPGITAHGPVAHESALIECQHSTVKLISDGPTNPVAGVGAKATVAALGLIAVEGAAKDSCGAAENVIDGAARSLATTGAWIAVAASGLVANQRTVHDAESTGATEDVANIDGAA